MERRLRDFQELLERKVGELESWRKLSESLSMLVGNFLFVCV